MKRAIPTLLCAFFHFAQAQPMNPNPAEWEDGLTRSFVGNTVYPDGFREWFHAVRLEGVHVQWMMKNGRSVIHVLIDRVEPQCGGDGLGIYNTIDRASLDAIVSAGGNNVPVKIMEFPQGMKPVAFGKGLPREAWVSGVPLHPTAFHLLLHGNCLDGTGPG
jgi:hypothetical protein